MVTVRKCGERIIFHFGKKLIVYNGDNVETVNLPEPTQKTSKQNEKEVENFDANILCLSVSKNHKYIAVSTESKQLVIFSEYFEVLKNFMIPRVASAMCFTSSNSLIVADKTGDVFLYDFNKSDICAPVLLMGHLSVVLDLAMTTCEKYIVTCDRDEKIRVSKFPDSQNVQSFCLGHTEFVSAVTVIQNRLISASGDGTIRFWNYINGEQLALVNTSDYIDQELFDQFKQGMNIQDVEVSALPITDMQCFSLDSNIFIGISLFQYTKLLIFSIDSSTLNVNSCKHVDVGESFSFHLSSELLILTSSKILGLKLENNNYKEDENKIVNIDDVHNMQFRNNQNINVLYKKKFDNVEEYIERKKARLRIK